MRVLDGNGHSLGEVLAAADSSVSAWPPSQVHRELRTGMRRVAAEIQADARAGKIK